MKTLKELHLEISQDKTLAAEFEKAIEEGKDASIAFVRDHGCDASFEEMMDYLQQLKAAKEQEITPEEMEFLAGGSKKGAKEFFSLVGEAFSDMHQYM